MKRSVRLPTRRARVMPPISMALTTGGLPLWRAITSPSTLPILARFLSTSCMSMMSRATCMSAPTKDLERYRHDRQDAAKGDDHQDCHIAKSAIGMLPHETLVVHEKDEGKKRAGSPGRQWLSADDCHQLGNAAELTKVPWSRNADAP